MKIIGHRGAAGLELENTLESIGSAIAAGVDGVEIDVRTTSDGHLVVVHDKSTRRVSPHKAVIDQSSLEQLRKVSLHGDKAIPTLVEAIKATTGTHLFIEGKGNNWAQPLAKCLPLNGLNKVSVISFNHQELFALKLLQPKVSLYALGHNNAFDVLKTARVLAFNGIDLNFWILNPLIYWLARRANLEIIVYTVNRPWIAQFLRFFYPRISITTDVPDQMGFLSDRSRQRPTR